MVLSPLGGTPGRGDTPEETARIRRARTGCPCAPPRTRVPSRRLKPECASLRHAPCASGQFRRHGHVDAAPPRQAPLTHFNCCCIVYL
ncbi:hypothetical protein DA2_2832 [Desulfovibrio sp. A2]|nr:hypothetical protein DA2_2832 [Desulfovibrio sp. A2]